MSDGVIEGFLRTKGALEIVIEIGHKSTSFQEIEDAVLVSSSTAATRLHDGVEKGLFEISHQPTDHGTQKRYELTRVGTRIYDRIQELDVDKTVRNLQRLQRERETDRERLIGRLNRDKLIIGYEHERNPPALPEDTLPPEEALGDLEPSAESAQEAAHQNRLDEDLVELDEEIDDEDVDQT